jgi:hypothetical protein
MGDRGYCCMAENQILVPTKGRRHTLNLWQRTVNSTIHSVRVLVEHAIMRIKNFTCLRIPWRHDITLHPVVFNVCSQITSIGMWQHPTQLNQSMYLNF